MKDYNIIEDKISRYFDLGGFHSTPEGSFFVVNDYDYEKFAKLIKDLDEIGYIPFMEHYAGNYRIGIAEKPERGESRIHINIILFIVTIVTTVYAGYNVAGGSIWDGVAFAVALLGILGVHETAHFYAARKHDVKSTLPYFVPAPTLIGTFGAVINIKSPIPDKNSLFNIRVQWTNCWYHCNYSCAYNRDISIKNCPNSYRVHDILSPSPHEHNHVLFSTRYTCGL